jgi:hypothetical protein
MSEPATEPPARPRYREGQVLQAQDLLDEQAYRIRARRCHAIGEHRWGIAQGLGLVTRNDGGITLQPGAAVDGYGRTLLVPGPVEVPASVLDTYGPMVDLWLGYCREPVTPAQRGTWACGPGRDSRWRERAVLRLSPAAAKVDPRRPPGVPPPDLDFPAHQAPPDDPTRKWPVYLGRLDTQTGSVDGARPYIGLVGDTVAAPSGLTRMQVGDEGRFAVGVTGSATPAGTGSAAPTATGPTDRLVVDTTATTVTGHTTVGGLLSLAAAAAGATGPNRIVLEPTPSPATAAPWTIRRIAPPARQLRIEIRDPGKQANPANYRLVVGRTDNGTFKPCLTVDAKCRTTIYGNLVVGGRITLGPIPADPNDPRFAAAVINQWMPGVSTAAAGIQTWYSTSLSVNISPPAATAAYAGQPFTFHLEVANTGQFAVTNIEVVDTVTIAGGAPVSTRTPLGSLGFDDAVAAVRTVTPPVGSAGSLQVSATVLGVGPVLPPVSAMASTQYNIEA